MAVNLNNYNTVTHTFDLLPQRLSIRAENKIHNNKKCVHWRFQDTVPLDYDVSMDDLPAKPDLETQLLYDSDHDNLGTSNLDFEHEEEEMVLDSEDEEINGSRVVIITKASHGSEIGKMNKDNPLKTNSNAFPASQHYDGILNERYQRDPLDGDGKKVISDETQEWSQSDALDFVDHFVSANRVDLSQDQEIGKARKSFMKKSPIVLEANGPRNLAKKAYMRARAQGHGKFDWVDNEGMGNPGKDLKMVITDFGNEGTVVGLDHMEPGFTDKERGEMDGVSEAIAALGETELVTRHLEDHMIVRDNLDNYEIGFNTQLAAEAIEALAHASPFDYRSVDTEDVSEKDSQPKDTEEVLKCAKRKKRSERKFGRGISSSSKENPGPENQLRGGGSNSNKSSGKCPLKPIEQSGKQFTTFEASLPVDSRIKGQFDKVYSRTRRRTKSSSNVCSKKVENHQANSHGEKINVNMEHNIVVYRRKRSRVNGTPFVGGIWNYPKGKRSKSSMQRRRSSCTHDLSTPKNTHLQHNRISTANEKREERSSLCTQNSDAVMLCRDLDSSENKVASIVCGDKTAGLLESECITVGSKTLKNSALSNCIPCNNRIRPPLLNKLRNPEHNPVPVLKNTRRRRDITDIRILFSQHLDMDIIKDQKKVAARLRIPVVSCCTDATHFVANEFVRTRNMLEAIALGKPVVTHLWLESCGEANFFIDERNYILRDAKKEKEIGFCMPASLARAIHHPLLMGQRVLVTPRVKPSKEMIMNLVKAVNGLLVNEVQMYGVKGKNDPGNDDLLILSSEEDHGICQPFLLRGTSVYSSELLLNGIVTQKLEYKRHRLFANDVRRNCC